MKAFDTFISRHTYLSIGLLPVFTVFILKIYARLNVSSFTCEVGGEQHSEDDLMSALCIEIVHGLNTMQTMLIINKQTNK